MRRVVTAVCGVIVIVMCVSCGGVPSAPVVKNPMAIHQYDLTRPKQPVTFTVDCRLSDSQEINGKDYWKVHVADPNPAYDSLYAFAEKATPIGKQVFDILKDGNRQTLTMTLQVDDDKNVIIIDLPSKGGTN